MDYKDILDYEDEHQLSKEALKMDVLIIKKEKDTTIKKNIGQLFRGHNICEYKSETDTLSVSDYNKVNGYALLYSAFEGIGIEDITITLSVTKHPRELLKYLVKTRRFEIVEVFKGVFYVIGDVMPVQILESKRLSEDDNLFLKHLRSNLSADDIIRLLVAYQKQREYDENNAYINRIMEANVEILKEVSGMSMVEVDAVLKEAAFKKGWIIEAERKGIEKGRNDTSIEFARGMILDGEPIERIAKWTKLSIPVLRELQDQLTEK